MVTVLKGRQSVSEMADFRFAGSGENILKLMEIGNSVEIQNQDGLNNILSSIERKVAVGKGAKLPIEHYNVYFQEGGIETASIDLQKQIEAFTFGRAMGYNVMNYDYSIEDQVEAENNGIDLDAEAEDRTKKNIKAYINNYLPFSRLCALCTGTSLGDKVPELDSAREYSGAFGALRGEDVSSFLLPTATDKKRNHYRTVKNSAGVNEDDIYDMIRMLTSYRTYSKKGITILGAPSVIQKILGTVYTAPTNIDRAVVDNYMPPKPFGCNWVALPELEGHSFLFAIDSGRDDILTNRVEKSEKYQGIGILVENKPTTFSTVTDIRGSKLRIFPEERYLTGRESIIILDTNGTNSHADGVMQNDKSIKDLELLAHVCLGAFNIDYAQK